MSYLLDTCVLSELTKPTPEKRVVQWLSNQADQQLYLSVITVGELRRGVLRLPPSRKKNRLDQWLNTLLIQYQDRILLFDTDTAESWAQITTAALQQGRPLALADSYIAATAVQHKLGLVTRNVTDFQAVTLNISNPWEL